MTIVTISGKDAQHVVDFFDKAQADGNYTDIGLEEEENTGTGFYQDATIIALLKGALPAIGKMLSDYFIRTNKHEISIHLEGESGSKMTITLKNLSMEDVQKWVEEFKQNG